MKVAVSAAGRTPDSAVDARFGRAACFMVYDTETRDWTALENTLSLNAVQGAGIQAAEAVARSGARAVLTGHCGPKAFRALAAAGVTVYTGADGSAEQAVRLYLDGKLASAAEADVQSHW